MAVLLMFNDKLQYTLQELSDALQFKNDQLLTVLQTMVKVELLTADKNLDASTSMDTVISLNTKFSR